MDHKEAVEKNVNLFREFVNKNKDNIVARTTPFSDMIRYSEKVFLDMNVVMSLKMDDDTKNAIWKHLAVLLVMFDPDSKELVKSHKISIEENGEEDEFLNKIINRVSDHVSETGDSKAGLSDVLSSGLIPELVSDITAKMSNGTFDLGKMIASVEKMAGGSMSMDPQARSMLGMLGNLRGMGNM